VQGFTNDKDSNRSVAYTYDALNRIASATTPNTDCTVLPSGITKNWGEAFTIDPWGNLTNLTVTKCSAESLNVVALNNNRLSGFGYDAAGNMNSNGGATYTYDAEGRLATTAGVTYTYNGDGERVKKSNGTLYWGTGPMLESDLSGNFQREFIFAGGKRVARRDISGGAVYYYFTDHLGSSDVVTNSSGAIQNESDYFPYGGERVYSQTLASQNYKFTGKERDTESGLDMFGARYYGSSLGRFMTPDPLLNSGHPSNPQSWNRYAYVFNNPLRNTDPSGLYTCSGTTQQCSGFASALNALKSARDSYKKGSDGYNALNSALNAYGKAGVDNGVHVGFGATGDGSPAATTVGLNVDANGNKVTTADNPTGQNINVTFDPSKNGSTNIEAVNAGHEGIHVAEGSALVGALPMNLLGPDAQSVLNGPLNLTKWQTETDAYWATSYAARALFSQQSFSVGNGHELWNSSWAAVDVKTCNCNIERGISEELADPKGPHKVTPWDQGSKLIQ